MKAVITGDIIKSRDFKIEIWLNALKDALNQNNNNEWSIYRGDEFQMVIENAADAFITILKIKSKIKQIQNLDVRMSLGIGTQDFNGEKLSESNGTAFINSGRNLDWLKTEKINLGVRSNSKDFDENFNLIFNWLSLVIDHWSVVSAEIMNMVLQGPHLNQEDIAKKLNITQSSVSQRLKRAHYDLILETDTYFRKQIAALG